MKKQDNDELISIIVPVYKVEQFLVNCIDSILAQTYRNIEIVLVDDGSPDTCGEICDEYTRLDSRVQVLHKENGGLSDARNAGLKVANGEYVTFIDSDDVVDTQFVERLYESIKRNNADIAICEYVHVEEDYGEIPSIIIPQINESIYSNDDMLTKLYHHEEHGLEFVAWGKLYRKTLFDNNDIKYPVGKIHEDLFTTYKLVYYSNKITYLRENLYCYRNRQGSIMNEGFNIKSLDKVEANSEACLFFERNPQLLGLALNYHMRIIILYIYELSRVKRDKNIEGHIKRLQCVYKSDWKKYRRNAHLNMKNYIFFALYNIMPISILGRIYK